MTGRPKADRPLKRTADAVSALRTRRDELQLQQRSGELHRELDRRRELRRELADFDDLEAADRRTRRLAEAQEARAEGLRHHEALDRAQQQERAKGAKPDRAAEKLASLRQSLVELTTARAARVAPQTEEQGAGSAARDAGTALAASAGAHEKARREADEAAELLPTTPRLRQRVLRRNIA